MNSHTALIRSFGTTGVLLLLALVLLAIVSAIVAFDRWPESGSSSTVERIAVDRPEARRVETELVRSRRPAPVVRGVVAVRSGSSAASSGVGGVFLVADRGPGDQSDGGGFGPPPPPVPFNAPGEGGGVRRFNGTGGGGGSITPVDPTPPDPIRQAACGARQALGAAGAPLDSACKPGSRGLVRETVEGVTDSIGATDGIGIADAVQVELTR